SSQLVQCAVSDRCVTPVTYAVASGTSAGLLARRRRGLRRASQSSGEVIRITLSLYAHVLPHMQQQAAHTMDDMLQGSTGGDSKDAQERQSGKTARIRG